MPKANTSADNYQRLLDYIADYQAHYAGLSPTITEIQRKLGVSRATAVHYLDRLQIAGRLRNDGKKGRPVYKLIDKKPISGV